MEIKRDKYLNDLIVRKHNGLIKVVTGVRRCGKSYLVFHLFRNYLLQNGVDEEHIIGIELDLRKNRQYRDPDAILDYIDSRLTDQSDYYILLDEVQMLSDFEEVLNSLLHIENVDVYVTGSNSKLLSKDIITEFRGRGDEVRIHPLTFREFMQVYDGDILADPRMDSAPEGGFDFTCIGKRTDRRCQNIDQITKLLFLFNAIPLNDILNISFGEQRFQIANLLLLGFHCYRERESSIYNVVCPAVVHMIRQYIEYLKEAYLISEASRYDVKGRKYIGSPLKYYFEDAGLRNARLGFRRVEEKHLMENIIYNELICRGYNVDVGIVPIRKSVDGKSVRKQLEIDFVANMGSKRFYIQSAFRIPDETKEQLEKASLHSVGDSFKKIVIVKDVVKVTRDEKGITTMSLYDFLLNEDSLEL